MLKILVVDDHPMIREGIKHIISGVNDIVVTGEAANGREALAKITKNHYDVVVLDLSMPVMSGMDTLKQIKIEKPGLPVLILSIHTEEIYAARVFRADAAGYLTKESIPNELITAIRKVYNGGKYITPYFAEKLASALKGNIENLPHENLSDRELQIMCMIAKGDQIKSIAYELCLSPKTVSTYKSRILAKMRMKSNSDLTHYAIQNNLLY